MNSGKAENQFAVGGRSAVELHKIMPTLLIACLEVPVSSLQNPVKSSISPQIRRRVPLFNASHYSTLLHKDSA